jgi:hypothetical protein
MWLSKTGLHSRRQLLSLSHSRPDVTGTSLRLKSLWRWWRCSIQHPGRRSARVLLVHLHTTNLLIQGVIHSDGTLDIRDVVHQSIRYQSYYLRIIDNALVILSNSFASHLIHQDIVHTDHRLPSYTGMAKDKVTAAAAAQEKHGYEFFGPSALILSCRRLDNS